MGSLVKMLCDKKLITPPKFVMDDTHYEVYMGSMAYGVSDLGSDVDVYGFCIPPKENIFPHLQGEIPGFGKQVKRFDNFQAHHILNKDEGKEYDIDIYGIVRYFNLCMECNPNMIDSLFVPRRCIIYSTQLGEMVRENRRKFLSKVAYVRFKGYAHSQLHKMKTKNPQGKRVKIVKEFGFDVKFAYHLVRLAEEIGQILEHQDLDLEQNREQLKAIRRGEYTLDDIVKYFDSKEKALEILYAKSALRETPRKSEIKQLLLNCLEHHFGNLASINLGNSDRVSALIIELESVLDRYRV